MQHLEGILDVAIVHRLLPNMQKKGSTIKIGRPEEAMHTQPECILVSVMMHLTCE